MMPLWLWPGNDVGGGRTRRRLTNPRPRRIAFGKALILLSLLIVLGMGSWAFLLFFHLSSSEEETTVVSSIAMESSRASPFLSVVAANSSTTTTTCVSDNVDIPNHTTRLTQRPCKPIVVAYAISLIKVSKRKRP